ncbi:hypothetical protein CRUP_017693 [Coryphaenoides rupestris]|nr:hypothetical protein CRUP_017693 [Coryphaenoides rupestris]
MELPLLLEERLKKLWTRQQLLLRKEEVLRRYKRVKFTEYSVDLLTSFANCTGLELIFGLNALLRTASNTWNSSNARSLIRYCESQRYRLSWELGNVPAGGQVDPGGQRGGAGQQAEHAAGVGVLHQAALSAGQAPVVIIPATFSQVFCVGQKTRQE